MKCLACGAEKTGDPLWTCYGCTIKGRCHITPTGCWIWDGAKRGNYGVIRIKERGKFALRNAHRVAYVLWRTPVPEGISVLHLKTCGQYLCCNPDHLYVKPQPLDLGDPLPDFIKP